MKPLKINESYSVKLAENLDEIGIKRWTAIQQYIITQQTGVDVSEIKKFWTNFCQEFDRNSPSGMFIMAHNWLHNLSLIERGDNPDQMIFALITYESDDEPISEYSPDFLREKIGRMNKAGLSQGDVKREVENFINGILLS